MGYGHPPGKNPGRPGQPTAAQNQAQIAMAVADNVHCMLSSDLSGIYFAVQASYEQQFVSANQQALNAGVRYKAAFAKALKAMPALLQTTSATPATCPDHWSVTVAGISHGQSLAQPLWRAVRALMH